MADLTKTEEQEVEKSLDEEAEKMPHTSEADLGAGGEDNDGSASGAVQSAESEKEADSGNQDDSTKRKNLDPEDEPGKRVSIINLGCAQILVSKLQLEKILQLFMLNICEPI